MFRKVKIKVIFVIVFEVSGVFYCDVLVYYKRVMFFCFFWLWLLFLGNSEFFLFSWVIWFILEFLFSKLLFCMCIILLIFKNRDRFLGLGCRWRFGVVGYNIKSCVYLGMSESYFECFFFLYVFLGIFGLKGMRLFFFLC